MIYGCLAVIQQIYDVPGMYIFCCVSFELSCYYYSLRRWGRGLHWRDARAAALAAASRLLSYRQNPGVPPPQPTGQTTAVETTAVDQPLLQAYRSAKGTSCGPLVCLCYTRVAIHGRSFQSARVIVVVLPLPSVLDVFPSVEPITIVKVCTLFRRFRTKPTFRRNILHIYTYEHIFFLNII